MIRFITVIVSDTYRVINGRQVCPILIKHIENYDACHEYIPSGILFQIIYYIYISILIILFEVQ